MAIDDEIEVYWASYIFVSSLENVRRCRNLTKTQQTAYVHYELLISYLLEKTISAIDRGKLLADSDFLSYKNTRGRKFQSAQSLKVPHRLGTVLDEEIGIRLWTTISSTSSEVAVEQEALANKEYDKMFDEMEEVEKE